MGITRNPLLLSAVDVKVLRYGAPAVDFYEPGGGEATREIVRTFINLMKPASPNFNSERLESWRERRVRAAPPRAADVRR
ncbi:hypothetical protein Psi02_49430 [Planotetraspora silvatica]|uniref:Uncharacterized protein n=1 Tax=Planotetraspora silvatica TaxID=234614 RepID=A0A8J3UMB4_9ACTN|nr:hypothetical protein Psi02_49430 [Planotetraspora silvatica]